MKEKIGNQNLLYPMPVTIVGALVNGKVNFLNVAHIGILNASSPHLISLGMGKNHFTHQGIKYNKTFSVNIPSRKQIIEVDYVGLVSGKEVDKSNVFEVFYGDLKTAPIIRNCPLSMECRLIDIYETKANEIFIGEIISSYAQTEMLVNEKVDLAKVDPLLFDMSSKQYFSLGEIAGKGWNDGKKYVSR